MSQRLLRLQTKKCRPDWGGVGPELVQHVFPVNRRWVAKEPFDPARHEPGVVHRAKV